MNAEGSGTDVDERLIGLETTDSYHQRALDESAAQIFDLSRRVARLESMIGKMAQKVKEMAQEKEPSPAPERAASPLLMRGPEYHMEARYAGGTMADSAFMTARGRNARGIFPVRALAGLILTLACVSPGLVGRPDGHARVDYQRDECPGGQNGGAGERLGGGNDHGLSRLRIPGERRRDEGWLVAHPGRTGFWNGIWLGEGFGAHRASDTGREPHSGETGRESGPPLVPASPTRKSCWRAAASSRRSRIPTGIPPTWTICGSTRWKKMKFEEMETIEFVGGFK